MCAQGDMASTFDLVEFFETLPSKQMNPFWENLYQILGKSSYRRRKRKRKGKEKKKERKHSKNIYKEEEKTYRHLHLNRAQYLHFLTIVGLYTIVRTANHKVTLSHNRIFSIKKGCTSYISSSPPLPPLLFSPLWTCRSSSSCASATRGVWRGGNA